MMTEMMKEEAFLKGKIAAENALVGASSPLFFQDEASFNEVQCIEAIGWNSVCVGEENQSLWVKERARIKKNRKYFEDGCLCIRDKKIKLKDENVPDMDALIYYKHSCRCSRDNVME